MMGSVCVDYNYIKGACICDGECLCRDYNYIKGACICDGECLGRL